jgi:predicted AAA+ superfamily ATPase
MHQTGYYPRYIKSFLLEALEDTPVVLIQGARQSGKTTLASQVAQEKGYYYISLDDDNRYQAAKADPVGFIRDLPDYVILDEIQRLPELFTSIKDCVDEHRKPGQFILTGSANVLLLPKLADSLAGRMEIISLRPLAQVELSGQSADFLPRLFNNQFDQQQDYPILGQTLSKILCSGSYPAALERSSEHRRMRWYRNYITTLVQRDVRNLAHVHKLNIFPELLSIAAGYTAQLFNISELASPFAVSRQTIKTYITFLEQLFLIEELPPWRNNQLSRITKTPKLHLMDTGLACALRGLKSTQLRQDRTTMGHLLETFVYLELRKHAEWYENPLHFYYFRDKDKNEVDMLIEKQQQFVGIEVKAAATIKESDFKGLNKLQKLLGDAFKCGIVLYDGNAVLPFGERLRAIPLSLLLTLSQQKI